MNLNNSINNNNVAAVYSLLLKVNNEMALINAIMIVRMYKKKSMVSGETAKCDLTTQFLHTFLQTGGTVLRGHLISG